MSDLLEQNLARAIRRWADPVTESQIHRSRAKFLDRIQGPLYRPWRMWTVAAAVFVCMAVTWLIVRSPTSRDHVVPAAQDDRISDLIEKLGSGNLEEREHATQALKKMGEPALEALREASKSPDPEQSSRARAILDHILLFTRGRIAYWGESKKPNPFLQGNVGVWVVDPEGGEPIEVLGGIWSQYSQVLQWGTGFKTLIASVDIPQENRLGEGVFPALWIVVADGSSQTRLTPSGGTAEFSLSPDGKRIAYVHYGDGGHSEVWLIDIDGANRKPLTTDSWKVWEPTWSPDGKEIIYRGALRMGGKCVEGSWGLYRISLETGQRELWTQDYSYPTFTPDGENLVVLEYSGRERPREIYLLNRSGKVLRTLAKGAMWDQPPKLSPDGSRIAFVDALAKNVVVADLAGNRKNVLPPGDFPTWSPDSKSLAYASHGFICTIDLATEKERRLVQGIRPTWFR